MQYTICEKSSGWRPGKRFEASDDTEAAAILTEMGWTVLGRAAETAEGLPFGTVVLEVEEMAPGGYSRTPGE